MNNTISHKEAAQAVKQINDVQADINRHSAKEYMPWIGWGYLLCCCIRPLITLIKISGALLWVLSPLLARY